MILSKEGFYHSIRDIWFLNDILSQNNLLTSIYGCRHSEMTKWHSMSNQPIFQKFPTRPPQICFKFSSNVASIAIWRNLKLKIHIFSVFPWRPIKVRPGESILVTNEPFSWNGIFKMALTATLHCIIDRDFKLGILPQKDCKVKNIRIWNCRAFEIAQYY